MLGNFSPWKIWQRLRQGLNSRTWVLQANTHPLDTEAAVNKSYFKRDWSLYNTPLFFINVNVVVLLFNTVIYVFLLLCLCILIVCLCIFIVPDGTLRLPWLRFFYASSSVVRQMPGYSPQRWGTARTLPKFLCCSIYCLFCVVLCTVCA
jgi:hypothetical protein